MPRTVALPGLAESDDLAALFSNERDNAMAVGSEVRAHRVPRLCAARLETAVYVERYALL